MEDSIAGLESFTRDGGSGDCIEALFTGQASELSIGPRDIVSLEASSDNVAWDPWFAGVTTKPGALRSPDLSSFKLVGLRKRVMEVTANDTTIAEGDVGLTVRELAAHLPDGVIYDAALVPDLGFTTGELRPRFEYLGVLLDSLADQVPGFIVPEGETYDYDGHTFTEGELVPPVRWGVLPDRRFFFKRTTGTLELTEKTGVQVSPIEPGSEELVTAVAFIFVQGSEYHGGQLIVGDDAATYGEAVKRVAIPVEVLGPIDGEGGEFYHGSQDQSDDGGATWVDWDQTTAYFRDGNDSTMVRTFAPEPPPGTFYQPAFASVGMGYAFAEPTFVGSAFVKANNLNPGGFDDRVIVYGKIWSDVLDRYDWANIAEMGTGSVEGTVQVNQVCTGIIVGTQISQSPQQHEVRCSTFTLLGANGELLANLAESYYRVPAVERLDVTVQAQLVEPQPFTTLTLATGIEVTLETAEVEYKITTNRGVESIVRMGQGQDADLLAQAYLIQGKADRAQLAAIGTITDS